MRTGLLCVAVAATAFAGCSGGGSSPASGGNTGSSGGGSQATTQSSTTYAIADTNALGSPLKNFADFDASTGSVSSGTQVSAATRDAATGACKNGSEFFAPDKAGDANSTESIAFFDSACTLEARDIVRTYTATGTGAETVNVTDQLFAAGDSTAVATRSETHSITGATFNQYGYPLAADGYQLVASDSLAFASSKTIDSGREFIIAPSSSGTNAFCSDSAGYNATGFPKMNDTFGWAGGVANGTRTANGDGSFTWTATHAGTEYTGAIGALSIAIGTPNTTCPVTKPDFTLAGGSALGTYSIPVTVTYLHGMIETLTVTGATLASGDTLTVSTTAGQPASSSTFITGSIVKGSTQISSFAVNAFGDGTMTVTATGVQYVITDWHVVT
jgi:hypothetical protein